MEFSVLHISDLHRDLADELDNSWLLESLAKDFQQHGHQTPVIRKPSICVVSGDLVYGVKPDKADAVDELKRQYAQAEDFLIKLANEFFQGDRDRIVLVPGNHDVSFPDVIASAERLRDPTSTDEKKRLVSELFSPHSKLRWSWQELCFYRIVNEDRYLQRLRLFGEFYNAFYQDRRQFSLRPEAQLEVFDFPEFGFALTALSSCCDNDPLHRAGSFHPASLANLRSAIRASHRKGWLIGAVWHHSVFGGPEQVDYLDAQVLQVFIDAGVSIGFHGHQHVSECVEERYRIGPVARKITLVSAGTLCAGPANLSPGSPRSFNIIEINTETFSARIHQRHMVNQLYGLPVWGPGHFNSTNCSYFDVALSGPLERRPPGLDIQLQLERASQLLGDGRWSEATDILSPMKDVPLARPLLLKALTELGDARRTIEHVWPPQSAGEAVIFGGAVLEAGSREEGTAFLALDIVAHNKDASVENIVRRIRERWRS